MKTLAELRNALPESARIAWDEIQKGMEWAESMYGPSETADYCALMQAVIEDAQSRITTAMGERDN